MYVAVSLVVRSAKMIGWYINQSLRLISSICSTFLSKHFVIVSNLWKSSKLTCYYKEIKDWVCNQIRSEQNISFNRWTASPLIVLTSTYSFGFCYMFCTHQYTIKFSCSLHGVRWRSSVGTLGVFQLEMVKIVLTSHFHKKSESHQRSRSHFATPMMVLCRKWANDLGAKWPNWNTWFARNDCKVIARKGLKFLATF